ncbi:3-phosphoshikimate 1-carboxyvinyltransferase [Aliidiomarina halalkaliphila]|uniref:3-phosphoshikimate 1-carboxyvinyltransferase n=1 Tax=Aliidiomarina halalkaliphila TaxID=2593535 RepID=A0A552X5D7_9GAMM|nr:3-phosphoshikimate 1-carboxyvinyltransferase [Aliidiomarina halalkaliphila]TRW49813.1 3-phosphoshikimate 1-carboxyvinyltransferase [Aliidiomarina halalkaliphila]
MSIDTLYLPFARSCRGRVTLPGSKSIANRALLLAALAHGETRLENMLLSEDTQRMREALELLGVSIQVIEEATSVRVQGNAGLFQKAQPETLFLGNAGTAMRPLAAILAGSTGDFTLTGEPRMYERPIGPQINALRQMGAAVEYLGDAGFPPLRIQGKPLTGGYIELDGSLSSQYVSAILMLLPLLTHDSELRLTGDIVSAPYINLTIAMMRSFGVEVSTQAVGHYSVRGGQQYQSPGVYWIEGDASSASYFLAAAAIGGGPVTVEGVGSASLQGDKAFAEVLAAMGADVTYHERSITVQAGMDLVGGDFDLNAIPDAAMTIATTVLFANGSTRIRNIYNWRLKETDRLHAMATELRKTGATVEEGEDFICITPPSELKHAQIATYDDHRMAMCFSLLTFAPCGVTIEDPECCRKTFPHYFALFQSLLKNAT